MPSSVRRTRWILGSIVVASIALVGVLAWVRPNSSPRRALSPITRGDGAASSRGELAGAESTANARELSGDRDTGASLAPARSSTEATGVLRVHVIDGATEAPVRDQECIVYSERDGNRIHAKVTTDAAGRARVERLPETTVLVCVPRSDRFANTTAGLWLSRGRTRDLEIRLATGGTIAGRVVDDLGRPIADAEVSVAPTWPCGNGDAVDTSSTVRTSSDGRFDMERVQSAPRAVWIVDGAMRPERWDSVHLLVRSGDATAFAVADVKDGGRVDRGDVVIERARTFAGRVLDHRREPAANAWIQLGDRLGVRDVPVDPTTWNGAHRALSSGDGSFVCTSNGADRIAYVVSSIGALQEFRLPKIGPGERVDDVEFVLDDVSVVEIELHDADGRAVVAARDAATNRRVRLLPASRWGGASKLLVALRRDDDVEARRSLDAGRDGIFRLVLPFDARFARRVHLELPGYVPWDDVWGPPAAPLERRRHEVRPLPTIRLHVRGPEQPAWADVKGPTLVVHACLVDPAEYGRFGAMGTIECCGLGSSWSSPIVQLDEHVDLPVLADRPFWIHARVFGLRRERNGSVQAGALFEQDYGPFSPDGVVHEVDVPVLREPERPEPRKPPPAEGQVAAKSGVIVRVRAIDADGRTVPQASVEFRSSSNRGSEWSSITPDGRATLAKLEFGRHEMTVHAEGYRRSAPSWVDVLADRENDFGVVVLELLPEFRVHFVEADGSVPPAGTQVVSMPSETDHSSLRGTLDAQGVLVARADPEARMKFSVREPRPADRSVNRLQTVSVEPGVDAREFDVRLLPWQTVEVVVSGAAVELPDASLKLSLREPLDSTANPTAPRAQIDSFHELMPLADGRRRFVIETYPGRFAVRGLSPLLRVAETNVEVRNSNDPQRFELSSTR